MLEGNEAVLAKVGTSPELKRHFQLLPDGQAIVVGVGRFPCIEVLIRPNLVGKERDGNRKLRKSIMKLDVVITTVLSGGGAMSQKSYDGARAHLHKIKIVTLLECACSWGGASTAL